MFLVAMQKYFANFSVNEHIRMQIYLMSIYYFEVLDLTQCVSIRFIRVDFKLIIYKQVQAKSVRFFPRIKFVHYF